ncbi:MAG: phage baseplate assembly protein V [Asticcacaulis sp.]
MFTPAANSDEILALIGDLIRLGRIEAIEGARVVVRVGDVLSPPLRWVNAAGSVFSLWMPPSEGEQVVVLSPEGDITGAIVICGLYSDDNPPPADGLKIHLKTPAGTFQFDAETGVLTIDITGDADVTATKVNVNCDLMVNGKITATGEIASDADVTTSGVSLKNHRHGNVASGMAKTGGPEA